MKKPRKVTDTPKIVSKDEKKSDNSSTLQVLLSELRKDTLFAPFVLEKLVENSTDDTFLVPNFSSKFLNDSSVDPFTVPVVPVAEQNTDSESPSSSPDDNYSTLQPLQLKKETYLAQELSLYRPLLVLEKSAERVLKRMTRSCYPFFHQSS